LERRIRVLIAKPGLDGHDRGAKVLVRALRDAGMEVIYTGIRQTSDHMTLFTKVIKLLKERGMDDVLVIGGGIIPEEDVPALKDTGISEVFGPGTPIDTIVKYIKENVRKKHTNLPS